MHGFKFDWAFPVIFFGDFCVVKYFDRFVAFERFGVFA